MILAPRPLLLQLLVALAAAGCSARPASERPTMIFAAASLTTPFLALAKEFERLHPDERLDLHFAGTPQLVLQLREGAPADVFAAADEVNMQRVVDAGIVASTPRPFASNRLAIVTAPGNPKGIRDVAGLARPDARVALCGPEVPAGRYARQMLAKAGVAVRSVSDEPSVKAVVSKVQLGEVDAGVVYVTDATDAGARVALVPIADEHGVVASCPIAVLSAGTNRASGEAFVAFVRSLEGQRILRSFGFSGP